MNTFKIYNKVIGLALVALTFMACSDTWDEHYDTIGEGTNDATLWQAITQNGNLSNFAKVVQACGYDKALNSSQVFTVFAPTNDQFSAQEADELIAGGHIGGGMLPKLANCTDAVRGGVNRVHILDGRIPHCLLLEIFTKMGVGTMFTRDDEVSNE